MAIEMPLWELALEDGLVPISDAELWYLDEHGELWPVGTENENG